MKPREYVIAALEHEETDHVPYSFGFAHQEYERKFDEYYGTPTWRDRLTPYIVNIAEVSAEKRDKARAGRDIEGDDYSTDIFGSVWRVDGFEPHLEKPILDEPRFDGYTLPTLQDYGYDFVQIRREAAAVREAHPDSFTVIRCGTVLFALSWAFRGFGNTLEDMLLAPDFYAELLEKCTDLVLEIIAEFENVDADAIMVGDDWGGQRGVLMGPELWRKFVKPQAARIYEAIRGQGKYNITHCCGSIPDIYPDLIEIGFQVHESVQPEAAGMNPYGLKRQFGDKLTFWGCVGSQELIPFGTPDEIRSEIRNLCREMGRGGGYILKLAKPIRPETPLENAIAAFETFVEQDGG